MNNNKKKYIYFDAKRFGRSSRELYWIFFTSTKKLKQNFCSLFYAHKFEKNLNKS